mgnify:CR=1 FL=1
MAQRSANKSRLGALPWIAPALIMILLFVVWPAFEMLRTSFQEVGSTGAVKGWAGFASTGDGSYTILVENGLTTGNNALSIRAANALRFYNSGNTFAIPLFLYKIELGSDIHDIHVDVFHRSSHDGLWQFWKNESADIKDWNELFDYDPYFARIPPGWEGK